MGNINITKILFAALLVIPFYLEADAQSKPQTVTVSESSKLAQGSNGWGVNQPILDHLYQRQKDLTAQLKALQSTPATTKRARCKQQSQIDKLQRQIDKTVRKFNKVSGNTTVIHRYEDAYVGKESEMPNVADARMSAFVDSMAVVQRLEQVNEFSTPEEINALETRPNVVPLHVITYKVQVAAVRDYSVAKFSILPDISKQMRTDGLWCVYSGEFSSFDEAQQACKRIASTTPFKDAFVVAFDNGKQIKPAVRDYQ